MKDPVSALSGFPQHATRALTSAGVSEGDKRLREVAGKFEAAFLSEMLKHAGLGKPSEAFGGGAGEEQFASLLRDAQADALADRGGIGLAESIFHALKERQDEQ